MPEIVITVVGEGKTDLGVPENKLADFATGVVPILVNKLCNQPANMKVFRQRFASLQGGGLAQSSNSL